MQGMPTRSAPATPDWPPATSTQFETGTSTYSAAARRAVTIFCVLHDLIIRYYRLTASTLTKIEDIMCSI